MFGVDALTGDSVWGETSTQFLTGSYFHWKRSRYSGDSMLPSYEEFWNDKEPSGTSGSALPVCFSPQALQNHNRGYYNIDKALPCACGTFSNETKAFMTESNMSSWVGYDKGKGLAEACQTSFEVDKTDPVSMYQTFCELGYRFPIHGDKALGLEKDHKHRFQNGSAYYCEQLKQDVHELKGQGKTDREIDCHMCSKDSGTGQAIKKLERSYVRHNWKDHRNNYNFASACEKFERKC